MEYRKAPYWVHYFFNVFLCDSFLFIPNIDLVSYADDNTPFAMGDSELEVINEIKTVAESLTLWFRNNCMKVNPDKLHLLLSDKKIHQVDICNEKLSSTCSEKLLGIKIDNKLTFEEHVEGLCKKASQKVSALARISSLMRFEQTKCIVNLFITSHFSYCPLVWMFHSRRLNNRINHIHERALRIIYQDYNSSFKELLRKDSSLTIHQRNLKLLVREMFKVKVRCAPDIMKEILEIENRSYNFCHDSLIKRGNIRSVYYNTETASFIGPKIWNTLPNNCKDASSLKSFKVNLQRWIPENFSCRLCKTYIQRVGFFFRNKFQRLYRDSVKLAINV